MQTRDDDRRNLAELGTERLLDLLFYQIRNTWRVDGLYFLGIEKRLGTEMATECDAECWALMGKLEARELKALLGLDSGIDALQRALALTSWALDHQEKEIAREGDAVMMRVYRCRTQLTRLGKALDEFPCKPVRTGYLEAFAREFGARLEQRRAPPDAHDDLWCEWSFVQATL